MAPDLEYWKHYDCVYKISILTTTLSLLDMEKAIKTDTFLSHGLLSIISSCNVKKFAYSICKIFKKDMARQFCLMHFRLNRNTLQKNLDGNFFFHLRNDQLILVPA
jgi:hypothetical protein